MGEKGTGVHLDNEFAGRIRGNKDGADVNLVLRSLKALSAAALQRNLTEEEVKEVSGAVMEL